MSEEVITVVETTETIVITESPTQVVEVVQPLRDVVEVNARGPQGPQGIKGDTGLKGDKGDTGAQGIQGIQGIKGDTGEQGIQGVKGDTGATGATGAKGDKGDTGAGVAAGGTAGQVLAKVNATDYNTTWVTPTAQVYPSAGIPNSTGSAWASSYNVIGTGDVVLNQSPTIEGNAIIGQHTGLGQTVQIAQGGEGSQVNIGYAWSESAIGSSTYIKGNVILGEDATYDTVNVIAPLNAQSITSFNSLLIANSGLNLFSSATSNNSIATTQTTGSLTIGGVSASGTTNIGRSTVTHTFNLDNGTLGTLATRTINIGVAGSANSLTIATIGTTGVQGSNRSYTLFNGTIRQQTFTVSGLPKGVSGARSFVTDALAPAFGAAVAGGGAVRVPVYHDGTSWRVG